MDYLRPIDLARAHGISTQAVRNYEDDGFLPAAHRTESGYRRYFEVHAAALRAYLALIPAYGYGLAGEIMRAVNTGNLDTALAAIDHGHVQLLRDRETLDAVGGALTDLAGAIPARSGETKPFSIGELGRRIGVTAVTLRNWEAAGILHPERETASGRRVYHAGDLRDAELTWLLRRGGYRLDRIRVIVEQIGRSDGTSALSEALSDWQRGTTARGVAMLTASACLARYVEVVGAPTPFGPDSPRTGG